MPLVFAAITPHPPMLIPSVGKESITKLEKTKNALEKLEEDLYLSKPDVIVIFSPHGTMLPDAFTVNVSSDFESDFKEFGDVSTKSIFHGEMSLAAALREDTSERTPIVLTSERTIDHGVSVPLFYLAQHMPEIAVLPIGFCALDAATHFAFGTLLKDTILRSSKRVAVIASADLSHALTVEAPSPFHPDGPDFDHLIQEYLIQKKTNELLELNPAFIGNAQECGYRSIVMLLGVLDAVQYTYTPYAYEAPFGVGYLSANFTL